MEVTIYFNSHLRATEGMPRLRSGMRHMYACLATDIWAPGCLPARNSPGGQLPVVWGVLATAKEGR